VSCKIKHDKYNVFLFGVRVRVRVFNATFNNISVLSWQSVLLVEETGVHEEVTHKLYHIITIST
jgi:hypothetical protein